MPVRRVSVGLVCGSGLGVWVRMRVGCMCAV